VWRKCSIRVFAVADNEHDQEELREDVQKFLYDLRMEATVRVLNARDSDVCCECNQQRSDIMSRFQRARKRILQHNGLPLAPVATIKRRSVVHVDSEQELAAHPEVPSRHSTPASNRSPPNRR
jgi:potassium/chloride transporter 4/5/6